MKTKALFLINAYSDYLNDFISELHKQLEVRVLLLKKNNQNTDFRIKKNKKYIFLKNDNSFKRIRKFKPDVVIVGGLKHPFVKKLLKYKTENKIKLYFWLERIKNFFFLKHIFYRVIYRNILINFNGIFAIGNEALEYYKKINKNTINLPYSINPNFFSIKRNITNKKLRILFVGQLIERKGVCEIVGGINGLPENIKKKISFSFIGNGPLHSYLKKIKKKYNFINIKKFQSRESLKFFFKNNDIFLFPSKYDGWGVAPMEAMASGLPIIISSKCGFAEHIKNNFNGFVINPNKKEITKKITYLFNNMNKLQKISKHGVKLISNTNLNSKNAAKVFLKEVLK